VEAGVRATIPYQCPPNITCDRRGRYNTIRRKRKNALIIGNFEFSHTTIYTSFFVRSSNSLCRDYNNDSTSHWFRLVLKHPIKNVSFCTVICPIRQQSSHVFWRKNWFGSTRKVASQMGNA